MPPLFAAEVAGALARRGHDETLVRAYVAALTASPHSVRTFGAHASRQIEETALRGRLRDADACYVWLAQRLSLPLCTLDEDVLARASPLCGVIAP